GQRSLPVAPPGGHGAAERGMVLVVDDLDVPHHGVGGDPDDGDAGPGPGLADLDPAVAEERVTGQLDADAVRDDDLDVAHHGRGGHGDLAGGDLRAAQVELHVAHDRHRLQGPVDAADDPFLAVAHDGAELA